MKKDSGENNYLKISLVTAGIEIALTTVFIFIFSAFMYFLNLSNELSPVLATISVAFSVLIAAYHTARMIGKNGYLIGSFVVDNGEISTNTLFHLIIILLASLIGGISGVNKKRKNFIK